MSTESEFLIVPEVAEFGESGPDDMSDKEAKRAECQPNCPSYPIRLFILSHDPPHMK
jgi:hypothetical protein